MSNKRIPDSLLPANNYNDGDVLYGSDLNLITDTLKLGVNANKNDMDILLAGTSIAWVRDTKSSLDDILDDVLNVLVQDERGYVLGDETIGAETLDKVTLYEYDVPTDAWVFVSSISFIEFYDDLTDLISGVTKAAKALSLDDGAGNAITAAEAKAIKTMVDSIMAGTTLVPKAETLDDDAGNTLSAAQGKTLNDRVDQDVQTTASPTFVEVKVTTVDLNDTDADSGSSIWNDTEDCVDTKINANVTLQNGRELLKLGRNTSGVTITNGKVVAIIGSVGNVAEIELLDISDATQSFKVIGIVTEDIANNAVGNVTLIGRVRGLNTSAWAEGTILYADVAGGLTSTEPTKPNREVLMAVVETSNAGAGIVWCWPRPIPHLDELSNVLNASQIDREGLIYNFANSRYEAEVIYSKAETDAAIAAVVDSAPALLDTLNELAAALGDDANFSTTVTDAIALREVLANKVTAFSVPVTDTNYASEKLVSDQLDLKEDKVAGSSLVTDTEIAHLIALDTQAELDAKLLLKVDKVANSSLVADTEITHLIALDTQAELDAKLLLKVDKVTDSSLVTDTEIAHLVALDTQAQLDAKIDLKEATANKVISVTGASDVNYPSEKAVKTYVDAQINDKDDFLELNDTPSAYTGKGHYNAKVNAGETALEFTIPDNNSITSIINGFIVTINTDTTKFDVASGYFKFVELHSDHMDTTHNTYAGGTVSALNITTTTRTYVGINSSGTIITQNTAFSPAQIRTIARIGYVNHPQTTIIEAVTKPITANQFGLTIADLHPHPVVLTGNVFEAASTDMTIKVSGGDIDAIGINYSTNALAPNVKTLGAVDPITFVYAYRDAGTYFTLQLSQTVIVPNYYDDDSGTLSELTLPANANKATVQGLYRTESIGQTAILYGQELYDTMADAIEAVNAGITFDIHDTFTDNKVFRGYLIVRAGATDLSLEADAVFKSVSTGAGGAGSTIGSLNSDKILNVSADAPTLARGANSMLVHESLSEDVITLEHKVDMVYVSAGQYKATVDNFVLTDGRKLTLLFPNTLTDLTTAVQVSFDNGVTYKYLKYDDTDNDVTVKHTQNLKTEVYYNNTEWLMNGEPLINQAIVFDSVVNSTNGAVKPIKGTPQMVGVKGNTFNQLLIDGDDFATSWTLSLAGGSVTDGVYSFTATAINGRLTQDFTQVASNKYYIIARVKSDNTNVKVIIYDGTTTITLPHSGSGKYELITTVATLDGTAGSASFQIRDYNSSGWSQVDVDYAMAIPITNTRYASHTADQMNAIIPSYIEGINSITDFTLGTRGLNLFDKSTITIDYYISTTTGLPVYDDTTNHSDYISVLPSTAYTPSNMNANGAQYDANLNFLGTFGYIYDATFTTNENTAYIRLTILDADIDTAQLEEGTTATPYVTYNAPSNDLVITTPLRSVGTTVHDYAYPLNDNWWLDSYVGYDTTVVKATTTWAITDVQTNTHKFYKDLTSELGYKSPSANSITANALLKIGTDLYRVVSVNDGFGTDTEGIFYITTSGNLIIGVNKTTYATSGDFETYLQANDVTFIYELDEVVTTEIPYSGSLIQESNTTLVQGNSNFATEYEIKFNLNVNAQVGVLVDKYLQVRDDVDTHDTRLDNIETKTDFITVTQAVDIDDIETNADASKVITDFITVTQAVNLDDIETNSDASKVKTDFITVTQAVDLDTMETLVAELQGTVVYTNSSGLAVETTQTLGSATVRSYDTTIPTGYYILEISFSVLSGEKDLHRILLGTIYTSTNVLEHIRTSHLTSSGVDTRYFGKFASSSSSTFRWYAGVEDDGTPASTTLLELHQIKAYKY